MRSTLVSNEVKGIQESAVVLNLLLHQVQNCTLHIFRMSFVLFIILSLALFLFCYSLNRINREQEIR